MQQTLVMNRKYDGHSKDVGCDIATTFLKKQSLCSECPFELCIKDIKYSTRILLQSNAAIKQIYEAYNQGLTIEKVSKLFSDIPLATIQYWIKHRNRIQKLLDKYSWAIQYFS